MMKLLKPEPDISGNLRADQATQHDDQPIEEVVRAGVAEFRRRYALWMAEKATGHE
jgi:hypothetical protein